MIGIGAPQALFVVVRVTPVIVFAVWLVVHVRVGEHWSRVMRFMKPAANYGSSADNMRLEGDLHYIVLFLRNDRP